MLLLLKDGLSLKPKSIININLKSCWKWCMLWRIVVVVILLEVVIWNLILNYQNFIY